MELIEQNGVLSHAYLDAKFFSKNWGVDKNQAPNLPSTRKKKAHIVDIKRAYCWTYTWQKTRTYVVDKHTLKRKLFARIRN